MHEGIPILNYHVPKAFTHEKGKLTGVTFEKVEAKYDADGPVPYTTMPVQLPGFTVTVYMPSSPGKHPVVALSCGTQQTAAGYDTYGKRLASYGIAVNPPAPFAFQGADLFVDVAAGMATPADFVLQRKI